MNESEGRKVIRMGNPILRMVSQQIQPSLIKSAQIQQLIADLKQTMIQYNGIGIAAPQIGILKQVCIIFIPEYSQRYGKLNPFPYTVVINPKITVLTQQKQGFWQGCLSIPGIQGFVRRPKHIRVDFFNENAEKISLQLSGMGAIVFQHETDHLFGILFIDKIEPTQIAFIQQFKAFELFKSGDMIQ